MIGQAFIFRTVVRVNALNQVWTGINQVFGQKLGGTVCGFVRQNGGVIAPLRIVDGDKQVIPIIGGFLPFEQRQPFGIEMYRLSGVGFIVAFGLLFEFFLNARSTLARRFIPYLACLKRLLVLVWGLSSRASAALRAR